MDMLTQIHLGKAPLLQASEAIGSCQVVALRDQAFSPLLFKVASQVR